MSLDKNIKYSYNDISIVPAETSSIRHRSECNPFYENYKLPIFSAPMNTVVDYSNYSIFEKNGINTIIPRTEPLDLRKVTASANMWTAFSLEEFDYVFLDDVPFVSEPKKILIDVANGHMEVLLEYAKKFKDKFKASNPKLMVGNIANPKTYEDICEAGIDYVRVSIGTGEACISSSNLGIHYPIASLIDEIKTIKNRRIQENKFVASIIADGGIRNYSDAVKALALGADYVMIGGLLSRMVESASKTFYVTNDGKEILIKDETPILHSGSTWIVNDTDASEPATVVNKLYKKFYGMASSSAQKAMHGKKFRTSEGIEKVVEVKYTLEQWVENFADYLRSAMSYTNARTLSEFKDFTNTIVISQNTKLSINK